jgi:hypothetical protein
MKMRHSIVFFLIFGWLSGSAYGGIYQSVDSQGNVTFSDNPGVDAKPVKLPPLPTYSAPRYPSASADAGDAEQDQPQNPYKSLAIIEPEQEGTVRDNPGNVSVTTVSEPNLRSSDRLQFYLDGEPAGAPVTTPQVVLSNVPRGEHQVEVAIVDNKGSELIRSSSITFFLHRQTIYSPARPAPAN